MGGRWLSTFVCFAGPLSSYCAVMLRLDRSKSCDREPARAPRVAVVGLGYWGPHLVRNLHELPDIGVTAVCDRRSDALAAINRRYPALKQFQEFSAVLRDDSV